jgi:hypothetical protein
MPRMPTLVAHESAPPVRVSGTQMPVPVPASAVATAGALAVGALAVGALAVGALAIGRMAIGTLALRSGRARRPDVEELTVARLRIIEFISIPPR